MQMVFAPKWARILLLASLLAQTVSLATGFAQPPAVPTPASIAPAQQQKLTKLLAVHRALSDGQEQLRKGRNVEAVTILERELSNIDGDREYLRTLQDAYQGAIQDLARSGNAVEADAYIRRLSTLQTPNPQFSANALPTFGAPQNNLPTTPAGRVQVLSAEAMPNRAPVQADTLPKVPPVQPMPVQPMAAQPAGFSAGAGQPDLVIRANGEDDPFGAANFEKPAAPKPLPSLKDAEAAFGASKFSQASSLYERAYRQGEPLDLIQKERWGYCKLASLVESFNKGQVHEAMIIEADQAVTLSPKLSTVAGKVKSQVLASLSQGNKMADAAQATEVKRVQGTGNWQAVESTWFRVFHQNSEEVAIQVARQADAAKASSSRRWLGNDGEHWPYRCDIWLYPTGDLYSRATGVPSTSPGHSTFQAESTRVLSRKIELRMDHPNLVDAVLPHEVTHVVLAGQFGKNFLPRWLDEGMAILSEPRERIRRHTDHIPRYASEGTLLGAGQLITLSDYPDATKVGIFYAQSVSLVEFLCSLKGTQAFTLFVKDAVGGDWETALKRHYNIDGFAGLERQWRGEWVALGK